MIPKTFNRIKIWALCRGFPPVYIVTHKKALAHLLVCLGSLSCWNHQSPLGNLERTNGSKPASSILVYLTPSVIPMSITQFVALDFEIPAQM